MTDTRTDDEGRTERTSPDPGEGRGRVRSRLGGVTTTTLVHRGPRGPQAWWRQAVVYQVVGAADLGALAALSAEISHVSRLGASAVQVRVPAVDPDAPDARETVDTLVRRAHQRSIRVIVSLAGTDVGPRDGAAARHRARVAAWLARDVDGVDLGVTSSTDSHEHEGVDLGALHALAAEADSVLTGGISARTPDALAEHLHEDWLHVTRDDRLAVTTWDAPQLRATVSDSYLQRDAVGAPAGWTLTDLTTGSAPSWGLDEEAARRRRRAATLLMTALPGTAYVSQGEPVGIAPRPDDPAATITEVARLAAEQRGTPGSTFERYRHAFRLRQELSLGTGHVAWVDDLPYAGTLGFVNRDVLVLTNLSDRDVRVPAEREILQASDDLSNPLDGMVSVPPDTTVWIALS
ncbi:hypothetical protein [Georgenia soli]|uniref:hypothetical protein n=1 Tax=Georgenia soli TaxID=638953 RepID=UPI000BF84EDE|nr:hypothetical protein [Georgenia soli]